MQWKEIRVRELKPGMVLMNDIFCPRTGILLFRAGTPLQGLILSYLQKLNPDQLCYVRGQDRHADTGDDPGEETLLPADLEDSPISEGGMDKEAREILVQACRTLDKIYAGREIRPYFRRLYMVIEDLVAKFLTHPEMMLSIALQKKIDNTVFCHAVNVSVFSIFLGKLAGLRDTSLKELALAGIMHDVGMMDVPIKIWQKKGSLTKNEFNKIKKHSQYGYFRLAGLDQIDRQALIGVLQHHERMDGSGYPHGLKEGNLHLWGRILGIVDVFDAYTSERSYRKAHPHYQGIEYLWQNSSYFDKGLLHLFIQNLSFFPIGTRVLLNTGEKGIIMGVNKHAPHRPIVRVQKKDGIGERLLDLTGTSMHYIEKLL